MEMGWIGDFFYDYDLRKNHFFEKSCRKFGYFRKSCTFVV